MIFFCYNIIYIQWSHKMKTEIKDLLIKKENIIRNVTLTSKDLKGEGFLSDYFYKNSLISNEKKEILKEIEKEIKKLMN